MFLPQLSQFFQSKLKQIDQCRYIAPSLVCAQHDQTCRRSPQGEQDGDGDLGNTLRTGTCHTNCLWVLYEAGEEAPCKLMNFMEKLLAEDFHTCKDSPVCTDSNPSEGNFPASVCTEGLWHAAAPSQSQLHLSERKGRSHIPDRGWLHFFPFTFKHPWTRTTSPSSISSKHHLSLRKW